MRKIIQSIVIVATVAMFSGMGVNVKAFDDVDINDTNFAYGVKQVAENADADKNGKLSMQEGATVSELYFDGGDNKAYRNVVSLNGMEYFTDLQLVYLFQTGVVRVDLSKNTSITSIFVANDNTDEIIFPQNNKITKLQLTNYNQDKLDLSMLKELHKLELTNCKKVKKLDLSSNQKLVSVNLKDKIKANGKRVPSAVTKVVIGDNSSINWFNSNLTNLKTIKFGKNEAMKGMYIYNSKKLMNINTTGMPNLTRLYVKKCGLKKLNITKNIKLLKLSCKDNKLKNLNLTKNKKLIKVDCRNNKISKLNISGTKLSKKKVKCDKKVILIMK